jgi:glutamine synthetase
VIGINLDHEFLWKRKRDTIITASAILKSVETPFDIASEAASRGLSHVSVGCIDWNGRLRTKQIHVRNLAKALREGTIVTSAIFATDTAEQSIEAGPFHDPRNGYRDAVLALDARTARVDPLTTSGDGLVILGNLTGEFGAYCPRALLRAECARLEALGLVAFSAFEIECHMLQETVSSLTQKVPSELCVAPEFMRMYSFVDQAMADGFFGDLRRVSAEMAIPLDSLHAEFSGLLEAGLVPMDGVIAADHLVLYKAVVKTLARRHGAVASFMAQLSNRHESAGAHLNLSLRDLHRGTPMFYAPDNADQMSETLRAFVAGLQRYIPELFLLFAPHLNSYKRLKLASFVPRTNTWAIDNKTACFRVVNRTPELARIEIRVVGADVNPYLALAAALAAGRRGIEEDLQPSPQASGNALDERTACGAPLPLEFTAAIENWRGSALADEIFGAPFVGAFAQSREWQLERFARAVTDWEVRQFAECV